MKTIWIICARKLDFCYNKKIEKEFQLTYIKLSYANRLVFSTNREIFHKKLKINEKYAATKKYIRHAIEQKIMYIKSFELTPRPHISIPIRIAKPIGFHSPEFIIQIDFYYLNQINFHALNENLH